MMRKSTFVVQMTLIAGLLLAACAPTTTPTGTGTGAQERPAGSAPQRTLVVALRQELPSIAARPLVPFSMALNPALFIFNAMLDITDERDQPRPYLAEA